MANVFTWAPDFNAQLENKPAIRVAAFGDGYEQRTQFGLNADADKWTLRFTRRDDAIAGAIYGFLKSMGGLQSFQWTAPGQTVAQKWVCRSYSKAPTNGTGTATTPAYLWDITAQFDQVFEP